MADSIDTPEWKKFVADYKATFKDGFPSPSLFAYLYYINTKATLDALDAVKGDLSNGQKAYREALQKTNFKGPAGEVKIDANRNGVGTTYITEVAKARRRLVLQQGRRRRCPTSARRWACLKPSSRRWASARATCLTAGNDLPERPGGRLLEGATLRLASRSAVRYGCAADGAGLTWLGHPAEIDARSASRAADMRAPERRAAAGRCADSQRVTRAFGALARGRRRVADRRRRAEVRDPRLQRRRQDHAVQHHHRRLSADRRAASSFSAKTSPRCRRTNASARACGAPTSHRCCSAH